MLLQQTSVYNQENLEDGDFANVSEQGDDPFLVLNQQLGDRNLKIAHLNINGLLNKLPEVHNILDQASFDILGISETHLREDIPDEWINVNGYSFVRRDRDSGPGGGVLIYFKANLTAYLEALRENECLKEKEKDIAKLTEQNQELQCHINTLEGRLSEVGCTGKKLGELGLKQRSRRLKELKGRAQVALWFRRSCSLEVTCLKGVDQKHGKTYTIDLEHRETLMPGSEKEHDDKVEQVLYLLDKFCASDELYHKLTIMCDELPKSYLIKQKRRQLNDICTIESVPGHYPGAQISFTETLKAHIKDLQKDDPSFGRNEPVKVKISGDGAKMSRSKNFMILLFSLL
ncbi:hypothetical protein AWC38_SpisGene18745 [Stylophora pistillata]|uniref:Endonuclease/exonuclease/phosphatase domain-containing protein n=1 Tax=Stylophora pistillata TaxID=50429 RepID=A0A2B4RJF8_STYPI|nr:hypothetical protein AWC38_SpisGene18745 [Stylophora pistillata]